MAEKGFVEVTDDDLRNVPSELHASMRAGMAGKKARTPRDYVFPEAPVPPTRKWHLMYAIGNAIKSATRQIDDPYHRATAEHPAAVSKEASVVTVMDLITKYGNMLEEEDRRKLIFLAACEDNGPVLIALANAGWDLNIRGNDRKPPLEYLNFYSDAYWSFNIPQSLPFLGGDDSIAGWTPLAVVAAQGDNATVAALIELKADQADRNPSPTNPLTATLAAARNGRGETLRLLLQHGIRHNSDNLLTRSTLLTEVAAYCTAAEIKLLVNEYQERIDARTSNDSTALMHAAGGINMSTMVHLLESKASIAAVDQDGNTAFHYLARRYTAELNPDKEDKLTPSERDLLLQRQQNLFLCAKALKRAGLDVDKPNKAGETPLMVAATRGDLVTAQCLLNLGASPRATDKRGRTAETLALDFHCYHGHTPSPEQQRRQKIADWLRGITTVTPGVPDAAAAEHPAAARAAISAATLSA